MATLTNLDNEIMANSALEGFIAELLPLSVFSRSFSDEAAQRGGQVLVPLIAGLSATTFTGTYNLSGGTQTVVTVTINRHKRVAVGQDDLTRWNSSRANLEAYSYQMGAALGVAVLQDILSLVTTANFGQATAIASTAMDIPQIRACRLALNTNNVPKRPRALILDCTPYDALLSVTNFVQAHMAMSPETLREGSVGRAMGFDLYELNSQFIAPSVIGFAAHADAIAIAMRYLAPQEGNSYRDARPVTDPVTGATFGIRDHYDDTIGQRFINLEAVYGYSVGISQGGRVIRKTEA